MPRTRQARSSRLLLATALLAGGTVALSIAARSQSVPGMVIDSGPAPVFKPSATPPDPRTAPRPVRPAAVAPETPKPQAKPKPKPAAKKPVTAKTDDGGEAPKRGGQTIVVLVNDEPISAFDVERRVSFMMMSSREATDRLKQQLQSKDINERFKAFAIARNPTSREQVMALQKEFVEGLRRQAFASVRPKLRERALDELIDERLKLQEGKKLNLTPSDEEANKIIKTLAERNKMTPEQFDAMLKKQGAGIDVLRERFRANLVWRDVVRRKFGHQISVGEGDVQRIVAKAGSLDGEEVTELQLHKITLKLPKKTDQKVIVQRLAEAEQMRQKFAGCTRTAELARTITDANFEDLGTRKPSSVPQPTRALLLNAQDNEMAPPAIGATGVELYAVCGRKAVKLDEKRREAVQDDLRQRDFEALANRHLKDVREEAHIERR